MTARILRTAALLFALLASNAQGQVAPPLDPQSGVVRAIPPLTGAPIGGVGAGTFQVNSDGSIGRGMWTHNAQRPLQSLPGCFAAVWTKRGERTQAKTLALKNAYSLPAVQGIEFQGMFPEAFLTPADPTLPLQMRLRVFSPLIPHDLRNSSFPAGLFLFELKNPSSISIEVSVLLSWENALGAGGTAMLGEARHRDGGTALSLPDEQGFFGVGMQGPALTPGNSIGEHLRDNTTGEMALLVRPPRKEATISTAGWNALEARPSWWERFAKEGTVAGTVALGREGETLPAGAIAVRITLRPGDYAEIPFAVAWRVPHNFALTGVDYGDYADKQFPSAVRTAQELLTEYHHLIALTEEPQRRLLSSNLPRSLVSQIVNCASILYTHIAHGRTGECGLLSGVGEAGEARSGADFASPFQTLAASGLLASYFPQLNAANLERIARTQTADGAMPSFTGNLERGYATLLPAQQDSRADDATTRLQNTSAYLLLVAQHCLWTGNEEALRSHYPNVQRALGYLFAERERLNLADSKESATLLANALNGGAKLAIAMSDPALQKRCEEARSQLLIAMGAKTLPPYLYNVESDKAGVRTFAAQAAAWYALETLAGFEYDPKTEILRLAPQIPGTWRTLSAPITMPRFWGRIEFKPRAKGYLVNFRLDRLLALRGKAHFGGAGTVLTVQGLRTPKGAVEGRETNLIVSLGLSPIGVRSVVSEGDNLLITFQSPVKMSTGDRLEVELR